jgi:hypothetical protein
LHRVERWAKLYHVWMLALRAGDGDRAQRLMNVARHAHHRLDDDERAIAWAYYCKEYKCHS